VNYFFSEEEQKLNASLDPWELLLQMGFNENSLYREGNTVRLFCPLHKDQIRRSMIVYTDRNTFKCQYTNCEGHKGGNLLEFYSTYMGVPLPDVAEHIRNQGNSGTDLIDRADKLIQEGNLVDALPLLQKAVQLDPTYEISRCRLAALYLELGDKEAGYKEYMTAAEHFGVRGELDKTLNIYNILVIISPDDVKVRKQLSYLFSRLKRQDEAVAQLKWVVDRHVRKGELGEAAQICKKMIELCPEYPDSHRILGEILLKQGNYFDAVEELRAAAASYIRENNLKKAKETVDLGLRYTPGNPAMKELRGKIDKAIELKSQLTESKDEKEQEFELWLNDLKASVGLPVETGTSSPGSSTAKLKTAATASASSGGSAVAEATPPLIQPSPDAQASQKPGKRETSNVLLKGKFGSVSSVRSGPLTPPPMPHISPDDPRIEFCRQNLEGRTADEMNSLHQHLVSMFNDVQHGFREGNLSEFEANVLREFYAAFCLAFDSTRTPVTAK
jgi:tetratricopeptide (TPR) repeat protein